MSSKLLKNTGFYTFGMLFPKVAQFILLPVYTRYMNPSDFGILGNMQVINSILVLLFTFSLNKAIYRLYHDFTNETEKRNYLGTIFIGVTISTIVLTGILFILSDPVGSIYKSIPFYPYFSLTLSAMAVQSFFLVPKTSYFVKEKAGMFVTLSILEFLGKNAFIVVFVVFWEKGVIGYLQGQLIGNLVLLPVFLFLGWKQMNINFNKSLFIKSFRYSFPLLPMALSGWVMQSVDRIFIERYFDTHEVGIYTLGYKIAMLAFIFINSFYKAYNPFYFKTASKNRNVSIPKLKKTNTLYLIVVFLTCSLIVLFAKEAISILFDERYYEAYHIVTIVGIGMIFGRSSGIFTLSIYQSKKTSYILIVFLIGAAVNIGLNFIFVPKYGAYGAAWATMFTFILRLFLMYYSARKCFYPSFNKTIIVPLLLLLLTLNIGFYFSNLEMVFSIVFKVILVGAIAGFMWYKYKNELLMLINKN